MGIYIRNYIRARVVTQNISDVTNMKRPRELHNSMAGMQRMTPAAIGVVWHPKAFRVGTRIMTWLKEMEPFEKSPLNSSLSGHFAQRH